MQPRTASIAMTCPQYGHRDALMRGAWSLQHPGDRVVLDTPHKQVNPASENQHLGCEDFPDAEDIGRGAIALMCPRCAPSGQELATDRT